MMPWRMGKESRSYAQPPADVPIGSLPCSPTQMMDCAYNRVEKRPTDRVRDIKVSQVTSKHCGPVVFAASEG